MLAHASQLECMWNWVSPILWANRSDCFVLASLVVTLHHQPGLQLLQTMIPMICGAFESFRLLARHCWSIRRPGLTWHAPELGGLMLRPAQKGVKPGKIKRSTMLMIRFDPFVAFEGFYRLFPVNLSH